MVETQDLVKVCNPEKGVGSLRIKSTGTRRISGVSGRKGTGSLSLGGSSTAREAIGGDAGQKKGT